MHFNVGRHPDLFSSDMARPADQEMTAMLEEISGHSSLETGGPTHHVGPHGNAPGQVRRQEK